MLGRFRSVFTVGVIALALLLGPAFAQSSSSTGNAATPTPIRVQVQQLRLLMQQLGNWATDVRSVTFDARQGRDVESVVSKLSPQTDQFEAQIQGLLDQLTNPTSDTELLIRNFLTSSFEMILAGQEVLNNAGLGSSLQREAVLEEQVFTLWIEVVNLRYREIQNTSSTQE